MTHAARTPAPAPAPAPAHTRAGHSPLREVAAATGLLTRLPVTADDRGGAAAFGLVGAAVGATVAAPLLLLGSIAPLPAAILGTAALAVASGALHLDGLADTADALAASSPAAAERARQDPGVGPAGAVALVLVLGLDAALLAAIVERAGPLVASLAAIAAAAGSRAAAPLALAAARGRVRPGFGSWFADRTTMPDAALAVGSALVVAVLLAAAVGQPAVALAGPAGVAAGAAAAAILARLREGLDGDALGAVVELSFSAALLAVLVVA